MRIFLAFFKKEFTLLKRYFVNTLAGGITLYMIFLIIFLGYKHISGGGLLGETTEGLIIGYIMWIVALSSFQDLTMTIQDEKKQGTIGQLFMSGYSTTRLLLTKAWAQLLLNLVLIITMLLLLMATTGNYLKFNVIEVIFLLLITNFNFWGIGFLFGGLTLIYKRMENYLQIVQFSFMALILIPVESSLITKVLPGTWGIELLRKVIDTDVINYSYSGSDLVFLILPTLFYFSLGIVIFRLCAGKAIQEGIVEQY